MDSTAAARPAEAPDLSRNDWVQMRLVEIFMRSAWPALHAAMGLIAVVLCFLWPVVPRAGLLIWAFAAVSVIMTRYYIIGRYQREMGGVGGPPLDAFLARYDWIWPLGGAVWGSLTFVFFEKAPLHEQFLCMLLLLGLGGFTVGTFSACLRCFSGFVHGMGTAVVAAIVLQIVRGPGLAESINTYSMLAMVLVYWASLHYSGLRFHGVHRATLELQFDNEKLIASLTEKSRAAEEAVEIKNRFIASAAHDLRQPVHALDIYAGWLMAEPEFVAQIAPKIVRSTKAVADLFDSLFDLAGLDADPLRVHPQDVDLAAVVKDLEVQYLPMAEERGLRLRIRAPSVLVTTDPVLLKRLVGNLVSNALRNTRQGGVLLAVRQQHAGCSVEVWDTGVGIAVEHHQAIFQEFYRIPMQGTEEGFGLGLAIVSRLSRALGCPVRMTSRVGRGSLFRVVLPYQGGRDAVA